MSKQDKVSKPKVKLPAPIPSTQDLEKTLEVLEVLAGDDFHFPYLVPTSNESAKVRDEIRKVLEYRRKYIGS